MASDPKARKRKPLDAATLAKEREALRERCAGWLSDNYLSAPSSRVEYMANFVHRERADAAQQERRRKR